MNPSITLRLHLRYANLAVLILIALFFLASCQGSAPVMTPGPIHTLTPTATLTPTPTPMPLGSPQNPLIMGVVSSSPDLPLDQPAQALAKKLTTASKISVSARVFIGYRELLDSMAAGETHIAFLPPLTYLYASKRGLAESALLTNHFGVFSYGSQFIANASSGFKVYYDPLNGKNSAGSDVALAQFADKIPCWVDKESTSGYILPAGLLAANNVNTGQPAFTQSHASVVRTLYIKGVCDFGATFAISGDPRTASSVLNDLPDALTRIPIIWKTDALIPNLNISYLAGLQTEIRTALTSAFLDIASTADGRMMISNAAGGYEIEAIKPIEDPIYDPLRAFLDALNLDVSTLVGK